MRSSFSFSSPLACHTLFTQEHLAITRNERTEANGAAMRVCNPRSLSASKCRGFITALLQCGPATRPKQDVNQASMALVAGGGDERKLTDIPSA